MTIEPNNIKKLKQRNYNLVVENEFLKEENKEIGLLNIELHKTIQQLKQKCTYWENEHDILFVEIEHLTQKNTKIQQEKIRKDKTIERLITIITDEHYN